MKEVVLMLIEIGSVTTTQIARSQKQYKWVVLFPLEFNSQGHVTGGYVYALTQKRSEAEEQVTVAEQSGESALIVGGCNSSVSVNEVFVD